MIKTNKDYAKRIKDRLVSRNEVYKHLKLTSITKVLNYFTKNIETVVFINKHVSITDYLNIYPDSTQLFISRYYNKSKSRPIRIIKEDLKTLREIESYRKESQSI